ncbi:hypothetical protein GE09DRAFT_1048401 [Coniochaeta sp. 2T2.1]|nr:hypothetical protein GE09DRAFT_1048401 [Coniochaeta sp. 2T2.1]
MSLYEWPIFGQVCSARNSGSEQRGGYAFTLLVCFPDPFSIARWSPGRAYTHLPDYPSHASLSPRQISLHTLNHLSRYQSPSPKVLPSFPVKHPLIIPSSLPALISRHTITSNSSMDGPFLLSTPQGITERDAEEPYQDPLSSGLNPMQASQTLGSSPRNEITPPQRKVMNTEHRSTHGPDNKLEAGHLLETSFWFSDAHLGVSKMMVKRGMARHAVERLPGSRYSGPVCLVGNITVVTTSHQAPSGAPSDLLQAKLHISPKWR